MAAGNSTGYCSRTALKQCSSQIDCSGYLMSSSFNKSMKHIMWRIDALLVASTILAGAIVGIGVFGQRYRHQRFSRFIFLGATTLFLPVVSTIVSLSPVSSDYVAKDMTDTFWLAAKCEQTYRFILVIVWASLVPIIMISTSAVVAVEDREGRSKGPPFEVLVQGFWTFYLGVSYFVGIGISASDTEYLIIVFCEAISFALTCAKMVFKYYAFQKACQSFALGRNPQLIFEYMKQKSLQETSYQGEPTLVEDAPPPLLVMGEEKGHMVKLNHVYVFKHDSGTTLHQKNGLVTIDSIWKLACIFPMPPPQLKDLCLSFAMFKLLRCRFARYNVINASSSDNFVFFWSLLLKDGGHDRVFQLISDEISFVHDYYYSSIPISYSKCWLPIVGIFISILTIVYCIMAATWLSIKIGVMNSQIIPRVLCSITCIRDLLSSAIIYEFYGRWYFDLVPVYLLIVLVVIVEMKDMASYICSNWTKVALVCRMLNCVSSGRYLYMKKWVRLLLCYSRYKLMRHWDEEMGQCSVLVPRKNLLGLLHRLFHLPDQKRKVKVPAAVKVSIMEVLRNNRNGHLRNGTSCLRSHGQVGESFLWACYNESTSYTILTWHIATSILEVRYPHLHDQEEGSAPISDIDYKMVATHLSRYCTYLVTCCPELLPDDHEWSRSLYEDVKEDAQRVLAGCTAGDLLTPEAESEQFIELLNANAKHEVVKDGARLGKQLAELVLQGGDVTAWNFLAEFWSEMILYVAPSDNLKGHKEAIARGGELITLLWVLLFHAGIVSRPDEDDHAAATSSGVV